MRKMKFSGVILAAAAAAVLCMNGCSPKGGEAAAASAAETTAAAKAAETTEAVTVAAETTAEETTAAPETTRAAEFLDEDVEGGPGAGSVGGDSAEIDEAEMRGGKGHIIQSNKSGDRVKPEPTEGVMPEPAQ